MLLTKAVDNIEFISNTSQMEFVTFTIWRKLAGDIYPSRYHQAVQSSDLIRPSFSDILEFFELEKAYGKNLLVMKTVLSEHSKPVPFDLNFKVSGSQAPKISS